MHKMLDTVHSKAEQRSVKQIVENYCPCVMRKKSNTCLHVRNYTTSFPRKDVISQSIFNKLTVVAIT